MFLVLVHYTKPLSDIDALRPAHMAFLDEHFAKGTFLFSGPRDPRVGGVIAATCPDEPTLRALLAEDPFARAGAATYEVIRLAVNKAARDLARLRDC